MSSRVDAYVTKKTGVNSRGKKGKRKADERDESKGAETIKGQHSLYTPKICGSEVHEVADGGKA